MTRLHFDPMTRPVSLDGGASWRVGELATDVGEIVVRVWAEDADPEDGDTPSYVLIYSLTKEVLP